MRHLIVSLLALCCLTAHSTPAQADYPHENAQGGALVTTLSGDSQSPSIISDGAGGSILAWNDYRTSSSTSYDIYAQRLDAHGRALWGANGRLVCDAFGSQNLPRCVPDGAGGVVIVWRDERTSGGGQGYYAQRLSAAGDAQWTANGVLAFHQTNVDYNFQVAPDASGGAYFIAPRDSSIHNSLVLQRLTGAGSVPWGPSGILLQSQILLPTEGCLASDGAGGAIVGWLQTGPIPQLVARRYNFAGSVQWSTFVSSSNSQVSEPQVCADGSGGACFTFVAAGKVYAARVNSGGGLPWGFVSVPLSTNPGAQFTPRIAADGSGGALVIWAQGSVQLSGQRVSATGALMWSAAGMPVTGTSTGPTNHQIAADGLGGLVAAWEEPSAGSSAIGSQRLNSAGSQSWGGGALLFPNQNNNFRPAIAGNGNGGALLAWDGGYSSFDIFAQVVDRYGFVGNNAPAITAVSDVAADQGGHVKVSWNRAWPDNDPTYGVEKYRLWRSVATHALSASARRSRAVITDSDEAASTGALLADMTGATDYAWELVATQPAALFDQYSLVAATGGDSSSAGLARTAFRVEALASSAAYSARWMSAPDSGYSVDNLPPAAPVPFTGSYSAGTTVMTWQPNSEGDLAGYRLYRGASAAFVPGPANLLATPATPFYTDIAGSPFVYKLTAVDAHGNESAIATLFPAGTLDAGGPAVHELAFAAPSPNPARGATTLRFSLPAAGRVTLALYDPSGRRVRVLREGMFEAGPHAEEVDLREDSGRALAPGLYLARLEAAGRSLTRRIVAVR